MRLFGDIIIKKRGKRLFGIGEVAKILGVTSRNIYFKIHRKKNPLPVEKRIVLGKLTQVIEEKKMLKWWQKDKKKINTLKKMTLNYSNLEKCHPGYSPEYPPDEITSYKRNEDLKREDKEAI